MHVSYLSPMVEREKKVSQYSYSQKAYILGRMNTSIYMRQLKYSSLLYGDNYKKPLFLKRLSHMN